jgi:hypothetical protein
MLRTWGAVLSALVWCGTADAQSIRTQCFGPPQDDPVDLFLAMQSGWLDGRVIVRDQYHGKLVLQNLTTQPIAINLPQQLGARPVLAQQGFPGLSGQNSAGGGGATQAVGGSPSLSSGRNGFLGNGPFNIAPEQVRIVEFRCFCLDYGKPNPRSAVKYELAPLAEVNDDPRLPELIAAYMHDDLDRETAQAAVWHAANDLSWDDLAALSQRLLPGVERPLFNTPQLRRARTAVESIEKKLAAEKETVKRELVTAVKPPKL